MAVGLLVPARLLLQDRRLGYHPENHLVDLETLAPGHLQDHPESLAEKTEIDDTSRQIPPHILSIFPCKICKMPIKVSESRPKGTTFTIKNFTYLWPSFLSD
jgi:hypothetical protein